ncbi:mpv17-like protein isoform X1 [Ischnura elegans]|uniref:mpv17-like protein isoform X1 n=1 Tax=Ischnura elegans TaxID=197161 RepID=UPI001ED88A6A|nr:mpv17-like protein isoform X1 [Ischnura elegans]
MAAINAAKRIFRKHPVIVNSLVYGTLYVGAEFSQQTLTRKILVKDKPQPYDTDVIKRYAVIGTIIYPNVLYAWYKWLDGRYVGTAAKTVVKKLLLDQFVLTPPLLVVFYVSMSLMERKSDLFEECRNKLIPTFKTSCVFWLPAQTMNFLWIPPAARVIYVGTCAFAWVNILCWIKRQDY